MKGKGASNMHASVNTAERESSRRNVNFSLSNLSSAQGFPAATTASASVASFNSNDQSAFYQDEEDAGHGGGLGSYYQQPYQQPLPPQQQQPAAVVNPGASSTAGNPVFYVALPHKKVKATGIKWTQVRRKQKTIMMMMMMIRAKGCEGKRIELRC
jgi:hypothetical protein